MSALPWQPALLLTIAITAILCGLIALVVGIVRALRREIEPLYPPYHAVGRDCYHDRKGLTK